MMNVSIVQYTVVVVIQSYDVNDVVSRVNVAK